MVVKFGQYIIDLDIEKTKYFYENAEPVSKGCSCDGCLNFEKAIDVLPQTVREFFANLGVDMSKVCECYVNCTNEDGTLSYGGFYHICGTLLDGESAWKKISDTTSCWDESATFSVSSNFHISVQKDIALLEADFPLPAIQLEFSANIPWVLEKENTYR